MNKKFNVFLSLCIALSSVSGFAQDKTSQKPNLQDKIVQDTKDWVNDVVTKIEGGVAEKVSAVKQDPAGQIRETKKQVSEGVSIASGKAGAAFRAFDKAHPYTHEVALRMEYVYWVTFLATLTTARYIGDVSNSITEAVGTPEVVNEAVAKGLGMVVLWTPAYLVIKTEIQKRFARLGYILPMTKGFVVDSVRVVAGKNVALLQIPVWGAKTVGRGGLLFANYSFIFGWMFLSTDAMGYTFASRETLVAAEDEIVQRLKTLRAEIPEIDEVEKSLEPYDRQIANTIAMIREKL